MTDIPASTSTTASISVGGSVTGSLEIAGDHDWYRINLTAGQTVVFSLDGSGLTPDPDSYLNLRNASGTIIASNDDSGGSLSSAIYFQVTTSGTYFLDAGAWDTKAADNPADTDYITGTYVLSVGNYTAPPVWTYDQIATQLTEGFWDWSGDGPHRFNVTQGGTITVDISTLNADEKTLARTALAEWSDIIGVNFQEVTSGGQIVFSNQEDSNDPGPIAQTDSTSSGGFITRSNVDISTSWVNIYGTSLDSYSFQTYLHEIGHALGLGHSGDYNGDASYATDALFANDSWATSVMSYFAQDENFYFQNQGFTYAPILTPMEGDIVAMQQLYGLSTNTRSGDSVYGTYGSGIYSAATYPDAALTIYDTGGTDTLDYSSFLTNQVINLNPETFSSVGWGVGNLVIARGVTIENAFGGAGNDNLTGNAADNVLQGGAGNDTIDGGMGSDTASYRDFNGGVTVDLSVSAAQNTGDGTDTLISIENLFGGMGANTLTGSSGNNNIAGGGGNDQINAAAGDDTVSGAAGDDFIDGGAGADTMTGGIGDDTFVVDNAGDVVSENVFEGADLVQASISFVLGANVENLTLTGAAAINGTGNALANVITGNSAANILDGGAGADTMIGAAGNDTYVVDDAGDTVTENAGEGTDLVQSSLSFTLGANVENLTLTGASAINGTGNALNNVITGNSAANVLNGGAGADTMAGGAGDDSYLIDNAGDVVSENSSEGTDLVNASATYVLGANIENLTLTGGGAINGTGNALANVIRGNDSANALDGAGGNDNLLGNGGDDVLTGGLGNDVLNGGTGNDSMSGGAGNDTYYLDNLGDALTENAVEGTDLVAATFSYTLGANVENLTLLGTADLDGTGNALNNTIRGNSGANVLDGLAGDDALSGGAGDDTYYVDSGRDRTYELAGGGTDIVYSSAGITLGVNIENLILTGSGAIKGVGNAIVNTLTGNDSANALYGMGGDDTLVGNGGADSLDGGAGADTMTGGTGNDVYYVDSAGDAVTENAGEGTDTVASTIGYTLGANLERLTLLGSGATAGLGNELGNVIKGNDSDNMISGLDGSDTLQGGGGMDVLSGDAGNDRLSGGAGFDYLIGGSGNDIFAFAAGDTGSMDIYADDVEDFTDGQDRIDVSAIDANSLLSGDQEFSFVGTAAFSSTAGELRYEQVGGNTYVSGDTNGDSIADFMIKLDGLHTMASTDFVI